MQINHDSEAHSQLPPGQRAMADFHCAAGWSHRAAQWSGFRFRDVWDRLIVPNAPPLDARTELKGR